MRRLLPLALLALAACIDDLEPQFRVTDLRILAVRAEVLQPEAGAPTWADAFPGDEVRLVALVANPRGRAPLEVAWYACPPEIFPSCPTAEDLRDDASLAAAGLVPLAGAAGCTADGATATCTLSTPVPSASDPRVAAAVAELGALVAEEPSWACRLYAEVPVIAVVEAEGLRELAVKRVRLAPDPATLPPEVPRRYVRNENPAVGALHADASEDACLAAAATMGPPLAPASFPGAATFLCGRAEGVQTYDVCDGGVPFRDEMMTWQWYATGGEFREAGTIGNATGDSPEFVRPAEAFTLWAILRDGRGGTGWTALAVPAAP